ncbi:MAG: 4Fe-4S dicluster domain-containing protein [Desulfobacteraceae bacterium]|nr:4Fe-4S dicluster domain-containing protein [Desulfobacteraceae bacterium]MBU4002923.1 4Fe-4S dicluster domain-containing protein [Pseudomonadota bacterium]MBU4055513.1 4Fe-4S dicluster domain-containing protein [Pseudomonadota bacterium]
MDTIEPIYKELAARVTKEKSKTLPFVLKKGVNLEQAKILRELPNTVEGVAEKLGLDVDTVSKEMQILFEIGVAMRGRKRWSLVNHIVLVKDLMASANAKYIDDELLDLLHVMSLEGSENLEERVKNGEKIPVVEVMRVLPKWRTIKDIQGILPIEDVREIFKVSPIVVHNCPCRKVLRDSTCDTGVATDICLAAGATGQGYLDRGAGKEITYDEVMALLDKLDESPVVCTVGNSDTLPTILCNCCTDCCGLFVKAARTKPVLGKVPYAKSRFVVKDNPEECTDCGLCLGNRCPVGAISMKEFPGLDGERSFTDVEECIGCGLCVLSCPTDARTMKLVRLPEHIPDPASMFDASNKD